MTLDPRADFRLLDQPIEGCVEVEPPSWLAIAVAWAAGMALVVLTWSGVLFG